MRETTEENQAAIEPNASKDANTNDEQEVASTSEPPEEKKDESPAPEEAKVDQTQDLKEQGPAKEEEKKDDNTITDKANECPDETPDDVTAGAAKEEGEVKTLLASGAEKEKAEEDAKAEDTSIETPPSRDDEVIAPPESSLESTGEPTSHGTKATESTIDTKTDGIKTEETAALESSDATTIANGAPANQGLQHSFQPGDHVIRWEMLPIVWPIQVHGIVLEVNQFCVTICDFGLTAEMRQDVVDKEQVEHNLNEDNKKGNKRLQEAWDRVKPPDNRKKERITVHIITSQEEIKPWKKVHYGRGLFGMGNNDGEGGEDGANPGAHSPKKGAQMKQKVGNWFKRVNQNIQHRRRNNQQQRQNASKQEAHDTSKKAAAEADNKPKTTTDSEEFANKEGDHHRPSCLKGDFAAYHHEGENGGTESTNELTKSTSDPSLNTVDSSNHSIGSNANTKDGASPKPEKNKLPESDPPKLVLARTRLLLEQGENILPPYHPFKSNSECIAVFCKTGYWRTLQASVFLHSTAIGNAKSSMAVTLGVAASVPLLAPAVALAGAAMVGAPYVILNQSHKTWQQETRRLNEAFWAQAPNEVYVECIAHWSGLLPEEKTEEDKKKEQADADKDKAATSQRFVSV